MRVHTSLYLSLFLALIIGASASHAGPRNVILIIGDGMDDHQITAARNYLVGAAGRLEMDGLAVRSAAQVLTVTDEVPGKPVYVADSANTATSLAAGIVTSRGRIATTAGTDKDVATIIEKASAAGMATGIVSTASVTDATPASFVAHISRRYCENPETMEEIEYRGFSMDDCAPDLKRNGGKGSISEQIADSDVDVVLGGGAKHFAPNVEAGGQTVTDAAKANGYHVITQPSELVDAPADKKLLGVFSPSTMPVKWQGTGGRTAEKPEPSLMNRVHRYLGSVTLPEPMTCEDNPGFAGMPTLKEMTDAALAHLAKQDKGFFLTIESASIDKQSHARNSCGSIGELEQLEDSLRSALVFANREPDTLILVTSDHGHAAQVVPDESLFSRFGVPVYTPGYLVRLLTPEGSVMAINYATNDFKAEEHTGVNVPLYANEAGRGLVPSMVTQPEIFDIMMKYLELE
jgi:alkaline phosphatase